MFAASIRLCVTRIHEVKHHYFLMGWCHTWCGMYLFHKCCKQWLSILYRRTPKQTFSMQKYILILCTRHITACLDHKHLQLLSKVFYFNEISCSHLHYYPMISIVFLNIQLVCNAAVFQDILKISSSTPTAHIPKQ